MLSQGMTESMLSRQLWLPALCLYESRCQQSTMDSDPTQPCCTIGYRQILEDTNFRCIANGDSSEPMLP